MKKPGIATHYQRYATSSILVLLAGMVSFPVLTRVLDNTQYGILGYYDTWVLMAVAIGKFGMQHSILRFYPHGGDEAKLRHFATNMFYLPLLMALALWLCAGAGLIAWDWLKGARQSTMLWLVLSMLPISIYCSLVDTVMRTTENSHTVTRTRVIGRWLELALMLGTVLLVAHTSVAAYSGKLVAAVLMLGFFVYWMTRRYTFSRPSVDLATLRECLIYGLPLLVNEIIAVALVSLDRLMLKNLLGDFASVGIYTIGSSLAMQAGVFLNSAVFEAFIPTANRLYVTEGEEAVRQLKSRLLLPLTYASIGAAALLWCFGSDVIVALSGSGKAASGPVFVLLGMVYALQPLLMVAGYGLLLEKRSVKVMLLMFGTFLVNAVLNLFWIPAHGVMGAVYATVVSSFALALAHCYFVPAALRRFPDGKTVLIAASVALALSLAMHELDAVMQWPHGWTRLLACGPALGLAYMLACLGFDARLRAAVLGWLKSGPLGRLIPGGRQE
ncbi:MAG: oligosaccharide flippase family protein [Pseudoxanthomonas sp.]